MTVLENLNAAIAQDHEAVRRRQRMAEMTDHFLSCLEGLGFAPEITDSYGVISITFDPDGARPRMLPAPPAPDPQPEEVRPEPTAAEEPQPTCPPEQPETAAETAPPKARPRKTKAAAPKRPAPWTDKELRIVAAGLANAETMQAIAQRLPGRNAKSIQNVQWRRREDLQRMMAELGETAVPAETNATPIEDTEPETDADPADHPEPEPAIEDEPPPAPEAVTAELDVASPEKAPKVQGEVEEQPTQAEPIHPIAIVPVTALEVSETEEADPAEPAKEAAPDLPADAGPVLGRTGADTVPAAMAQPTIDRTASLTEIRAHVAALPVDDTWTPATDFELVTHLRLGRKLDQAAALIGVQISRARERWSLLCPDRSLDFQSRLATALKERAEAAG